MKVLNSFKKKQKIISINGRDFHVKEVSAWKLLDYFEYLSDYDIIGLLMLLNIPPEEASQFVSSGGLKKFQDVLLELNFPEEDRDQTEESSQSGEENKEDVYRQMAEGICSLAVSISSKFGDPEEIMKKYSVKTMRWISKRLWPDVNTNAGKKNYTKTTDKFGVQVETYEEEC
jgi:hypothetical protein